MKREDSYSQPSGPLGKWNLLLKIDRDVKYKTAYRSGKGFFTVHWEVQANSPEKVLLHVEAPVQAVDASLNDLKRQVIQALLDSDIKLEAKRNGLNIDVGQNAENVDRIKVDKSTGIFLITLPDSLWEADVLDKMLYVDNILGLQVQDVLYQFGDRIRGLFK